MIKSIDQLYELYLKCSGVSTDSRKITKDCLFIALKGPNFDANRFADESIKQGAKYALVDEEKFANDINIFHVSHGLEVLQGLAKHHRGKLKIPVIGITGSNGKTTTKELMCQVLSTTYNTLATVGNLNNHIGVPLTVLDIGQNIELAIVEMGANHIGEIADLCRIAQPTHGLITNIGRAHIEGFGGFEGVIRGKSELYHYLLQNRGVVFINSQDEILANMAKRFDQPIFYPHKEDYSHTSYVNSDPFLRFVGAGKEIKTHLIGAYNFFNVAAALCVAKYFKVPPDLAEEAVANYIPTNNRSQVINKGTNTLILDAYNANPSSMTAAIENLITMNRFAKAAILGDMLELGEESEEAHNQIVALTKDRIATVLLCGPQMGRAKVMNPKAIHFDKRDHLVEHLHQNPFQNTTILIKASRSMGLEKITEFL